MKHAFKSTKITQLKVFGPDSILNFTFSDFPTNPMFVELNSWPSKMSAKDAKQSLINMGATMYLLDNNGNIISEEQEDHSKVYN